MTARSRAPRRSRLRSRAPPPTPIRTGRGARSAAANDGLLSEFLEASLRIPDLAQPPKRFHFPALPAAPDLASPELLSGSPAAARRVADAAAEAGAFRVDGAVEAGEVRAAVEAAAAVFGAPEAAKREVGRWLRRRDRVVGEELHWHRPVNSEMDTALEPALPALAYRMLREKMETVASKMEILAQSVIKVLSENAKNPKSSALPTQAPSILCLTQYNCKQLKTYWNEFGSTEPPSSYALSLHFSGRDQEICLWNQEGSTFFSLPAGSVLVTIGKQIQEWSNGEFKSAVGEILFELTDEPNPFISLELLYSPGGQHHSEVDLHTGAIEHPKLVSLRDQLLIALVVLALFYCLWT